MNMFAKDYMTNNQKSAVGTILGYLQFLSETILFFMSGIFFDISELGEPVRTWLSWNPALIFIAAYREVLLNQVWPDWYLLMKVMLVTLFILLMVSYFFRVLDRYYPRVVN